MDMDLAGLRAIEAECLKRFTEKARLLRAENPGMSAAIARAKAAQQLHRTLEKYLMVCSRLTFMGCALREWK
jgi:hypothetical protein